MARRRDAPDKGLDELYAAPLAEFTGARNELAKQLRGDGEAERAAEVKGLRKPSVPAWAINQGVRAEPKAVKRLLGAGQGLRDAGSGDALREAMREEAEAVEEMTEAAMSAAGDEKLGTAMIDRLRDTLRAVAGDDELREEFEAGRVGRDRKPVGLAGGLGGASAPKAKTAKPKRGPTAAQRRKADAAVKKAQRTLDAGRRDLADARERAEKTLQAHKQAERGVAEAEEQVERAEEELKAAEADRDV